MSLTKVRPIISETLFRHTYRWKLAHGQINQFHWHVADSQSFPLQVPGFAEVSQKGAYSDSMIYSPADVKDIVTYAGQVRTSLSLRESALTIDYLEGYRCTCRT